MEQRGPTPSKIQYDVCHPFTLPGGSRYVSVLKVVNHFLTIGCIRRQSALPSRKYQAMLNIQRLMNLLRWRDVRREHQEHIDARSQFTAEICR